MGGADWSEDETQMTKGWEGVMLHLILAKRLRSDREGVMKVNKFVPWCPTSWMILKEGSWSMQTRSFPAASGGWSEPGPPPWDCFLWQLVGEEQFHLTRQCLSLFYPTALGWVERMLKSTHFWHVFPWLAFGDNNHLLWLIRLCICGLHISPAEQEFCTLEMEWDQPNIVWGWFSFALFCFLCFFFFWKRDGTSVFHVLCWELDICYSFIKHDSLMIQLLVLFPIFWWTNWTQYNLPKIIATNGPERASYVARW